jgi:hypothetical protein
LEHEPNAKQLPIQEEDQGLSKPNNGMTKNEKHPMFRSEPAFQLCISLESERRMFVV